MIKKIVVGCLLLFVAASFVFAQSADELYSRAAQKYITGDLVGAESDLVRVLQLNSEHDKARQLLIEIRKELGRPQPVTPTTIAPKPAPRPTPAISPRPPVSRPKPAPRIAPKIPPKKAAPGIAPPPLPSPPDYVSMEGTINQIILLIIAVIIFVLIIAVRGGYFVIRDAIARSRMQVCPDCKTVNPESAEFCQTCGIRLKAMSGITMGQKKWFKKVGWKRNPFTLDVIPGLFTGYASQVGAIMEKASTHSGHILVYGDKGVGKTTLLRWLTQNMKADNHTIYVARPPIKFDDLLNLIVSELKAGGFGRKKQYSLYEIEGLVKKQKKPVIIMLDEAHEFTAEIEQQMRSLGDIQGLNFILGGLPETREKIKKDSPPFFDRIVLESYIDHLNYEETKEMIIKRIEDVGGEGIKPFTEDAINNIFKMSKGRPRMILKVCDWIMTDAIRNNSDVIGVEAGKDFPAKHEPLDDARGDLSTELEMKEKKDDKNISS
ncbi:MAG: AAA family ATPase [Candidatus Margulisiibacteriota bacterium]